MPQIVYPHDKAFKRAMQDIRVARDFCEHYLPEMIKNLIDLNTLKLNHATFIDSALKETESDVLYQAEIIDSKETAYIYVLAEHQSKPDKWIPFRLVKYMCEIFSQHLRQYSKSKNLPLIFPIVFYNGTESYNKSMCFFDLFGGQKEIATNIFINAFRLVDLNHVPDAVIRQHRWSGLMEMIMKQEKMRDTIKLWQDTIESFGSLLQDTAGRDYFVSMLTYFLHTRNTHDHAHFFATIREQLSRTHQPTEETIMTIAEWLKQEGRKQGMEQGIEQGIEQGVEKGRQEERLSLAMRLFEEFQDITLVARLTGLSMKTLRSLLKIC